MGIDPDAILDFLNRTARDAGTKEFGLYRRVLGGKDVLVFRGTYEEVEAKKNELMAIELKAQKAKENIDRLGHVWIRKENKE